jgi:hypothetical protein
VLRLRVDYDLNSLVKICSAFVYQSRASINVLEVLRELSPDSSSGMWDGLSFGMHKFCPLVAGACAQRRYSSLNEGLRIQ